MLGCVVADGGTGAGVGPGSGDVIATVSTTRLGALDDEASLLSKPSHAVAVVVSTRPTAPDPLTSELALNEIQVLLA
jgi:hypothetical protein